MKTACIIVVGHVDHGKTALVRALTGIETDRLDQEQQRGLSITLGFAHRTYASGTIDLIDAPGHEDFIHAMVAGATGAQAAMLVVSAVEGVAPQTLEHLQIARLLDVPVRVVAVTKADLVAPDDLPARLDSLQASLAAQGVNDAPLIPCSALKQGGTDRLDKAIEALLDTAVFRPVPLTPFLPIDRVFSKPGLGTVVTGTLLGGALKTGDAVSLEPAGLATTIRGLQTRGADQKAAQPGERTAVNLRGIAVEDIARGDVLSAPGGGTPSACVDVLLTILPNAPRPIKHMTDLRVLFGTAHEVATLRLMGGGQIAPGQQGLAQLRFRRSVLGYAGQRAILRTLSPAATVGGIEMLDPHANDVTSGDHLRLAVMQVTAGQDVAGIAAALCQQGKGTARLSDVARLARQSSTATWMQIKGDFAQIDADVIACKPQIAAAKSDMLARLASFHNAHPIKPMAPRGTLGAGGISPQLMRHVEAALAAEGILRVVDDQIALSTHDAWANLTDAQTDTLAEIEAQLNSGGVKPPDAKTLTTNEDGPDLLALLVADARAVQLQNIALKQWLVFHSMALARAAATLRDAFPQPASFTTSQARAALGTSRKFIVPMLEHFDAQGVTQRSGDTRQMAPDAQ